MAYLHHERSTLPFGSDLAFHLYKSKSDKVSVILAEGYFDGAVSSKGFMPGDWVFVHGVDGFALGAVADVSHDKKVKIATLCSSVPPSVTPPARSAAAVKKES